MGVKSAHCLHGSRGRAKQYLRQYLWRAPTLGASGTAMACPLGGGSGRAATTPPAQSGRTSHDPHLADEACVPLRAARRLAARAVSPTLLVQSIFQQDTATPGSRMNSVGPTSWSARTRRSAALPDSRLRCAIGESRRLSTISAPQ